jgi:hypothetical protein
MKLASGITINGRPYSAGEEVPGCFIYPFFLIHMLAFGLSGFVIAYAVDDPLFLYMHGGIAITVYLVFYLAIFGLDEVKWMLINAGIGLFGIASQIDWILRQFGTGVGDYPPYVHVIPFMYWILYTFMIRHAVLDLMGVGDDDTRRSRAEWGYVGASLAFYLIAHFLEG